ncbi:MAG: rRNA maturation RNase YbeY [Spirochaetota bacterium]
METDQQHSSSFDLTVHEEERRLPVGRERLVEISIRAFTATGKQPAALALVVSSDAFISRLNLRYRGVEEPTDVLSFPAGDEGELGDIVISLDAARRQAAAYGRSPEEEFIHLYVHGLLHLLGYNHGSRRAARAMSRLSDSIIRGGAKEHS